MKKQLTQTGAVIVMNAAIQIAVNVCIKCRENSGGDDYKKFTGMITELKAMQEQNKSGEYKPIDSDGDGLQIALIAYDVLCNEIERDMTDADETISFDFWRRLKRPHKHIDKRVKIQEIDSRAFKVEMLSATQVAYRECRQYIMQHTAPDTRRQKCYYFADLAQLTDENGLTYKEMIYTEKRFDDITREDENSIESMIDIMQLTATQNKVLTLRLKGYGLKAIATYTGRSVSSIRSCMDCIRKKFVATFALSTSQAFTAFIESLDTEE